MTLYVQLLINWRVQVPIDKWLWVKGLCHTRLVEDTLDFVLWINFCPQLTSLSLKSYSCLSNIGINTKIRTTTKLPGAAVMSLLEIQYVVLKYSEKHVCSVYVLYNNLPYLTDDIVVINKPSGYSVHGEC